MPIDRNAALTIVKEALANLTTARGLLTRPSQNQMISTIAQTLLDTADEPSEKGSHLVAVEAPTGTGKSFGYLLPAIPIAKAANKKIVVSTAVVSLQEQLFAKDLPALAAAMPMAFTFALAKGRSRFVCPSRLKSQVDTLKEQGHSSKKKKKKSLAEAVEVTVENFSVGGPKEDDAQVLFNLLDQWDAKGWNGEQETLSWNDEQKKMMWPKITTDNSGCSGKSCKDYKACPYFEARKKWKDADVIIANHDLVMSDLKIGNGGALLSEPSQTIYIFDEAHHLPSKARDAWSNTFRTDTFPKIIKEIPVNLTETGNKWNDSGCKEAARIGGKMLELKVQAQILGKEMEKQQKEFEAMLSVLTINVKPKEPFVIPYTEAMEDLMLAGDAYSTTAESLREIVQQILNEINKTRDAFVRNNQILNNSPLFEDFEMNRVLGAFGFYNSRLQNLVETMRLFTKDQPDVSKPPTAKWIVPDEKHKSFSIHATPTMATDILPSKLYDKAFAVVCASATLTSVNGFSLFKQKSGMCYYPNARTLKLDSPFDFKKNATLAFGDLGVNPSEADKHTQRLIDTLPVIFNDKKDMGTLVLFSSKAQLEQVASRLPWEYRQRCKVQYEAPNQDLIARHKADVDAGKPSILMGTQSFSEGLDLPGAWCSHVISTKLPFSMPDNPIDKTLTAWMESQGRNVFREIAIPEACERLIQQAGRLLRREDDTGQFTLLDNRMMTKWNAYGKVLIEALPPFKRMKWDLTKVKYAAPAVTQAPPPPAAPTASKGLPEISNYDATTFADLDETPW